MFKRLFVLFIFLQAIAFTLNGYADIKKFTIDDPRGRNVVRFESKAPIETIVGTTNKVTGYVEFDPESFTEDYLAEVNVDLRTLKTGIDRRDDHMYGAKYLDVENFSTATVKVTKITANDKSSIKPGDSVSFVAEGVATIHGVSKRVDLEAEIRYYSGSKEMQKSGYPGDVIHVDARFTIALADFDIKRPQFLVLKLDEKVDITINFTAVTGRE